MRSIPNHKFLWHLMLHGKKDRNFEFNLFLGSNLSYELKTRSFESF